ncbi:conjugal transfer/type IV secretion protein DotA/TraY [Massilia sp. UYP11]|uniref:DotA/TraY family protein n=1 Tax=Massilia sp. UYP11 TaxID=1756385 RepID=UPI003D214D82
MKSFIFLLMLMLMPQLAIAVGFEPSSDDISIKILAQMFGSLLSDVSGGKDAFGSAISTFNSGVLMIGGVLALYTILAGTLGTAHDGEMLGKKFSSVWLPIRYSIGTAIVLPILPGGYCVMQMLVMSLITQGVGMADAVWASYMTKPSVGANTTPLITTKLQLMKAVEDTFVAGVCVEAHKAQMEASPPILGFALKYDWNVALDGDTYFFGDQKGLTSYFSKRACGWVKYPKKIENAQTAQGATTTNTGLLGPLDNLFKAPDVSVLNDAHRIATATMITSVRAVAAEAVANKEKVPQDAKKYYAKLGLIADKYLASIQSVGKTLASKDNDSTSAAKKYGWFLAGAYHNNIILTNGQITSAMSAFPATSANISTNDDNGAVDEDVKPYLIADQVLAARGAEYGSPSSISDVNKAEDGKRHQEIGTGGRFAAAITEAFTGLNIYELKNETRGIEITLEAMGTKLLMAYGTLTLLMTAFSALALVPGTAGAIGAALQVTTSMLDLPVKALAATGFACAYILPNLPFIIWLGCIGGWLIQCVIAICVAPLWAVMHLHPNGDDLVGKGANGYMMVLGLLLRPTFLIFGFIATIVLSQVVGEFINKVFFQVFSFSQVDGTLGFFKILGGTILYAIISFAFLKKILSLMHVIPDEIMRWIGGGVDQLGNYAKTMGDSSHSGMTAAAAGISAARNNIQIGERNGKQISDTLGKLFGKGKGDDGGGGSGGGSPMPGGGKVAAITKEGGKGASPGSEERSESKGFLGLQANNPVNIAKNNLMEKIDQRSETDEDKKAAKEGIASSFKNLSPAEAQYFMEGVESRFETDPGQPAKKSVNSAYNDTLNKKFGNGTGSIAAIVGGGYHTEGAKSMIAEYQGVHSKLSQKFGADGANQKIEEGNKQAFNAYKNDPNSIKQGGNVQLKEFIQLRLSELSAKADE